MESSDTSSSTSGRSEKGFVNLHFTHEPQDTVVVRGGVLCLDCQARYDSALSSSTPSSSSSPTPKIMWRKDGVLLSTVVDDRRRQLENGSLLVQNVFQSRHHRPDEGGYQCVAALEGIGAIVSRTARVTVA
ncbi:netrin receptor DCC, partial [Lampris incognitus]|uniref:netrin receptor DCC n=1 Tax=Lampris incognitus TaxID=2546036 RepID=UPI0024B62E83